MPIHPIEFRYGSPQMKSIFTEESRLQKLLDVEAALARAHAKAGNIPKGAASTITKKATTNLVVYTSPAARAFRYAFFVRLLPEKRLTAKARARSMCLSQIGEAIGRTTVWTGWRPMKM